MSHRSHHYRAPAKINWFLHITGRRANGYHDLETVFQRIAWYDEIDIEVRDDGQMTLSGDLSGVAMERNLIYRAATMLQNHARSIQTNFALGAQIKIKKNIPTGAGLGGGSSDAATVLNALNVLWQLHLPNTDLQTIGLQLGADVPFFVSPFPAAFADGLGEQIYPIELPSREILLVKPLVDLNTVSVYQHPALIRNHPPLLAGTGELSQRLQHPRADTPLGNDMEAAAFALAPELRIIMDELYAVAPNAYVRMSGSGSTLFACPADASERGCLEAWRARCPENRLTRWCQTIASVS